MIHGIEKKNSLNFYLISYRTFIFLVTFVYNEKKKNMIQILYRVVKNLYLYNNIRGIRGGVISLSHDN